MNRILKAILKFPICGFVGKAFNVINYNEYMRYIQWYYRKLGVKIEGHLTYVSPDVYFDAHGYSLISLGNEVTISREVMFLVHDFSIHKALVLIGEEIPSGKTAHFLKEIVVGEGSFIGARVSLLPGTHIGANCIVGAGAVVKGRIPDNSIVIGNPAKVVGNVKEWAEAKKLQQDWRI